MRKTMLLVASLFVVNASRLFAADAVTLRMAYASGVKWTFDTTQEMTSNYTATMNGQSQTNSSKMSSRRKGTAEVLTVDNGVPTSVKFVFDQDSDTTAEMQGQQAQKMPFPYAGQTITLTRAGDGSVSDDSNLQADPGSKNELHQMMEMEQPLFNKEPVSVGQEWPGNNADIARMLQLTGPNDRGGMTLKLLSLPVVNGRPCAEVKLSVAGAKEQQGIMTKLISQGTAMIDLQTGHAIKLETKGTLESSGTSSGQGPDGQPTSYQLQGKGDTHNTMTSTISGASGPVPAPQPVPPVLGGGAVNPLGGGSYAGKYSDGKLTVDWTESNGAYTGTISLGTTQYPASAKSNGPNVEGAFDAGGTKFPFTVSPSGDDLILVSGGKTYTLKRIGAPPAPLAPVNPLGGGNTGLNPPPNGPAVAAGNMPTNYQIVKQSRAGVSLVAHRADVASAGQVLSATVHDLHNYFGTSFKSTGGYEDAQTHMSGAALFTASWRGQPVQGIASANITKGNAAIAILFVRNDAPPADRQALTTGSGVSLQQAAASIKLAEYRFPDNTGTIGIAEGWQTNAASEMQVVEVKGLDEAQLTMGFSAPVFTPNSQAVQTNEFLRKNARQYGNAPPPPILISPMVKPVQLLTNISPQLSRMAASRGMPEFEVSNMKQIAEAQPMLQGSTAAIVTFTVTKMVGGQRRVTSNLSRVDLTPIAADQCLIFITQMSAPEERFADHLPAMVAMAASVRENVPVIQQKTQQNLNQMNAQFDAQQRAHKELTAAYDAQHQQYYRDSNAQSRGVDDFDETIRGNRTVYDTITGYKTSVDLGNVDGIVNAMNEGQPGRYVQIPLRDEADPLVK